MTPCSDRSAGFEACRSILGKGVVQYYHASLLLQDTKVHAREARVTVGFRCFLQAKVLMILYMLAILLGNS
jgi:hypothetical protein